MALHLMTEKIWTGRRGGEVCANVPQRKKGVETVSHRGTRRHGASVRETLASPGVL